MHVESHAAQACAVPFAYLPNGVQSATHAMVPPGLTLLAKGWLAAHAVQSVGAPPAHDAQLAWHDTHASAEALPPPAQV